MSYNTLDSYQDYQGLVDAVYSAARSALTPVSVGKPSSVKLAFAEVSAQQTPDLEVLVTVDALVVPFYYRGMVWLSMLAGDANYRMFRVCTTNPPVADDWYTLTDVNQVVDPKFRLTNPDYIEAHDDGGGSGNGAISDLVPFGTTLAIPSRTQYVLTTHLEIQGHIINFGRLAIL